MSKTLIELINHHINGDVNRFDELWMKVDGFDEIIKGIINTEKLSADGWYLVLNNNCFDVYYQERGINDWGVWHFMNYKEAVKFVLNNEYGLSLKVTVPEVDKSTCRRCVSFPGNIISLLKIFFRGPS